MSNWISKHSEVLMFVWACVLVVFSVCVIWFHAIGGFDTKDWEKPNDVVGYPVSSRSQGLLSH